MIIYLWSYRISANSFLPLILAAFLLPKKNSSPGNYMRKYGNSISYDHFHPFLAKKSCLLFRTESIVEIILIFGQFLRDMVHSGAYSSRGCYAVPSRNSRERVRSQESFPSLAYTTNSCIAKLAIWCQIGAKLATFAPSFYKSKNYFFG